MSKDIKQEILIRIFVLVGRGNKNLLYLGISHRKFDQRLSTNKKFANSECNAEDVVVKLTLPLFSRTFKTSIHNYANNFSPTLC